MMRRNHLVLGRCYFLAVLALGAIPLGAVERGPVRPNVLFLMPDQMRGDCLSILGHPGVRTPHLDELAKQGAWFRRAYSSVPSCIPARYALLTGLYPQTSGVVGFFGKPITTPTLPGVLANAGYTTVLVGRNMHQVPAAEMCGYQRQILGSTYVENDEYDRFLRAAVPSSAGIKQLVEAAGLTYNGWQAAPWPMADDLHPTAWIVRESRKVIAETAPGEPLFLTASFYAPHPPLFPPKRLFDAVLSRTLPPAARGDWVDWNRVPTNPANRQSDRVRLEGEALRQTQAGYFGLIDHLDEQIGPLVADFKARSERAGRPWVVVVSSDHGEMLGDHGYFRKCEPYEGSANIPLIVAASPSLGFKSGTRSLRPVCLEDIMPTLLDLCGIERPAGLDGVSLVPVLRGEDPPLRAWLHFEHSPCYSQEQAFQALTDGRLKYIWRPTDGREQLFDLQGDPREEHNLAADPAQRETLAAWRARMIERLTSRPEGFSDGTRLIAGRQRAKPDPRTKSPRPKPQATSADADRETRTIAGWKVHISLKLLAEQKAETEKALELLQGQLDEIVRVVPQPAVAELQKVSLWVSPEYPGVKPTAEYHPDAGWLREHGRPLAMAKSVEFTNVRMFEAETKRMPNFTLHELAHAYHDRVLGFENTEIAAVYEKAKAAKTYDAVERWLGPGRPKTKERAYAMTNAKEYFAETTEAFFSRNDFFPFTRDELAKHDPEMLVLLKRLWRVPSADETAWKRMLESAPRWARGGVRVPRDGPIAAPVADHLGHVGRASAGRSVSGCQMEACMRFPIAVLAALFLNPFASGAEQPPGADVSTPEGAKPIVGAIRWDAWYGRGSPVSDVEKTLGPRKYHFRLPFFAKVLSPAAVRIDGDSPQGMEQEIAYAAGAGLNYWAFVDYWDQGNLGIALRRYRAAEDKKGLRFCLIEEGARMDRIGTPGWSRLVTCFKDPHCRQQRIPTVTFASAGWDPRPRVEHPVPWISVEARPDPTPPEQQQPLVDAVIATPAQLAQHVQDAINWTKSNRDLNPANAIIVYGWNENDEGGWLIPTWKPDGQPDSSRLDALSRVLLNR